jgi:cytidine deaminase
MLFAQSCLQTVASRNMPLPPTLPGPAELLDAARAAAGNAYAPYSKFRVGAALLFDDGFVATGCNVENASYGLTSCAERNAVFSAVGERGSHHKIVAIAVANLNQAASSPCGACRQVLSEFVSPDAVICFPTDYGTETKPFRELLPFSFRLDPQ